MNKRSIIKNTCFAFHHRPQKLGPSSPVLGFSERKSRFQELNEKDERPYLKEL
ncbi:MAG: hypothetical protein GVY07_02990 [Bacteroidetes bacterium]|nr:hypothetical protein [Bacteroidota bacterium]